MPTSDFRHLLNSFGKQAKPPLSIVKIAKRLKVSRTYLYKVMDGKKPASSKLQSRVVKLTGLKQDTVRRSAAATRATAAKRRRKTSPRRKAR